MHSGQQYAGRPGAAAPDAPGPLRRFRRRVEERAPAPAPTWLWAAAAWIGGGLVLAAVLVRVSLAFPVNSDGANIALQGWDLLHGHLLLHGWITADASYYTFELPLLAVTEACFGLTNLACHVASALAYAIVAALGVALARTNSSGAASVTRCGVVLAVMAAPLITQPGVAILVEAPQHLGTSAYPLGCFLLIDRAPGWRFTAPLAGAILCAGQVGDATVLYIAVPVVVLVCAYRVLAARKIRSVDAAVAVAAAVSVPAALLCRAAMRFFGAYAVVPPRTAIAPRGQWWPHAGVTWQNVRALFGALVLGPGALDVAAAFGSVCLLAAGFGLARVVWTWRRASRAEQLVAAALVINLVVYVVSTMPTHSSAREIAAVVPCGAVLAARACVPGRITGVTRARTALAAAAVLGLLPWAAAASQPVATSEAAPLAAWLASHRLGYGIAGYWDASAVTVQSGNRVRIRAIIAPRGRAVPYYWETKPGWYSPSLHRATFAIANNDTSVPDDYTTAEMEHFFGRPARIYRVAGREILVYRKNLLAELGRPYVPLPAGQSW
jgi:hypothetical protein